MACSGIIVRCLAALAVATLAACANSDPAAMSLDQGSSKAVVLMALTPVDVPYDIWLDVYDEKNQSTEATAIGGTAHFKIGPGQRYAAAPITPGTYVVYSLDQQTRWRACFHAASVAFDVRPGELVYMGLFDPSSVLDALRSEVMRRGDLESRNSETFQYLDGIPPPFFEFPTGRDSELVRIQEYVRTAMPKVRGTVRLAEYRPAKFGTGHNLFGTRICGGYFKSNPGK